MDRSPNSWLAFILVLAGFAGTGSYGEDTSQRTGRDHITELVRQLGADTFDIREAASRQLLKIGPPARPALEQGAKDHDLEIRRRCLELIGAIREAERQSKLAAFIADKDGKQKHDLPGWERYRKIAGEDAAARQFFIAILQADMDFLAEVENDRAKFEQMLVLGLAKKGEADIGALLATISTRSGERCGKQCQNLMKRRQTMIAPAEIAPVLLVAADPNVSIPFEHGISFGNLLNVPAVQSELRSNRSTPFKKIALAWMERQCSDNATAPMIFTTVTKLELKGGLDLALKAVRSKKLNGAGLAHALSAIGRLGGAQDVALLESFLQDKAMFCAFGIAAAAGGGNVRNIQGNTQVRDVALAMLVRLTKQSFKEYGFAISGAGLDHMLHDASYLGFSNDKDRDKAFAKWKAWKAAQKK